MVTDFRNWPFIERLRHGHPSSPSPDLQRTYRTSENLNEMITARDYAQPPVVNRKSPGLPLVNGPKPPESIPSLKISPSPEHDQSKPEDQDQTNANPGLPLRYDSYAARERGFPSRSLFDYLPFRRKNRKSNYATSTTGETINSVVTADVNGSLHGGGKSLKRWTPFFSGLICPFAILLEIPGLTEHWYVKLDPSTGQVVDTQANPVILDAGLIVSIVAAAIANLSLVARFLEKKPYQMTIIAVVALTFHDIINIIIVTYFGVIHAVNDGYDYGEPYWMTVASTVVSFCCNVTLVLDLVLTKDFKSKGSGLTSKQRTLVIAVMGLLCYLAIGALIFSLINELTFQDSLYFSIVTISTCGFGDLVPQNTSSRIFSIFYDSFGIICLGITIAVARETIIESFQASYRRRRSLLSAKARERRKQRQENRTKRLALQRELAQQHNQHHHLLGHHSFLGHHHVAGNGFAMMGGGRGGAAVASDVPFAITSAGGEDDVEGDGATNNDKVGGESMAEKARHGVSAGKEMINGYLIRRGLMRSVSERERRRKRKSREMDRTLTEQSINQEAQYRKFKKQLEEEQKRELIVKFVVAWTLFVFFWTVGAAVFSVTEGWDYFIGLYFCFVFFTTIGYGDYSPKAPAGRAFFIAWSLFGIATMTVLLVWNAVVTESWSTTYKGTITRTNVRKTLDNLRDRRKQQDEDGDGGSYDHTPSPEESQIPTQMIDAAKGFSEHAKYFVHGKQGEIPTALKALLELAEEADGLEKITRETELQQGDVPEGETKEFLFMLSYERSLDTLIETAERMSAIFESRKRELDELRSLNSQLRSKLGKPRRAPLSRSTTMDSIYTASDAESEVDTTEEIIQSSPSKGKAKLIRASWNTTEGERDTNQEEAGVGMSDEDDDPGEGTAGQGNGEVESLTPAQLYERSILLLARQENDSTHPPPGIDEMLSGIESSPLPAGQNSDIPMGKLAGPPPAPAPPLAFQISQAGPLQGDRRKRKIIPMHRTSSLTFEEPSKKR